MLALTNRATHRCCGSCRNPRRLEARPDCAGARTPHRRSAILIRFNIDEKTKDEIPSKMAARARERGGKALAQPRRDACNGLKK
jgi:hypothetical protein